MSPIFHLVGNVLAFALGALCAMCVARLMPALVAGDHRLMHVWMLRAIGAGTGCLGVAAMSRQAAGV